MTGSPHLDRLQRDLKAELLNSIQANPRARLTRQGRLVACLAVVVAVATPTGALALQGDDDGETITLEPEFAIPAPAPLCIDQPNLPVCDEDPGTVAPLPPGANGDLSPERLTPEQREELMPSLHPDEDIEP